MNNDDFKTIQAVFIMYDDNHYIFQMDHREDILFKNINQNLLKQYNLHSIDFIGSKFEITYYESFQDFDAEEFDDQDEFIHLSIENLKLIK